MERSFYECGKALMELRNRRLYRSSHKTFEEYCQSRFNFTRRNVNYLIAGSEVVDNLNYSDSNCEHMKEISDRITRLYQKGNLEDAAIKMLKHLGEVKRPYLTTFEEKLLNFLEQECGVVDEASYNQS